VRVQLLRRLGILAVPVNDGVRIWSKPRHLPFGVATVGAVCVGLDELSNSEAIRGFVGEMVTCLLMSWSRCSFTHCKSSHSRVALGSRSPSMPNVPSSWLTPDRLNPPNGAC
jgi:hypothetical protein